MVGGVVPVVGAVAADVRGQEGVVVSTGKGLQLVFSKYFIQNVCIQNISS